MSFLTAPPEINSLLICLVSGENSSSNIEHLIRPIKMKCTEVSCRDSTTAGLSFARNGLVPGCELPGS